MYFRSYCKMPKTHNNSSMKRMQFSFCNSGWISELYASSNVSICLRSTKNTDSNLGHPPNLSLKLGHTPHHQQLILAIELPLPNYFEFWTQGIRQNQPSTRFFQFSLFIRFRHFELQLFWWDFGNQRSFARNTKFMKGSFEWGAMQFRGNIAEPIFDIVP